MKTLINQRFQYMLLVFITSLEEVNGLSPLPVLRYRQRCCDVAPEAIKANLDGFWVTRVHHAIFKSPVLVSLQGPQTEGSRL